MLSLAPWVRAVLIAVVPLVPAGLARAQVPDPKNWTVQQGWAYWAHPDRNYEFKVTKTDVAAAAVPSGDLLEHGQYLIQEMLAHVPPSGNTLGSVVMRVRPTDKVRDKPKAKFSFKNKDKSLLEMHTEYGESLVYSYWDQPETLTKYMPGHYDKHEVLHYQAPWCGADPIYDGGTVGVVINGPLSTKDLFRHYWWALVGALVVGIAAASAWRKLRASPS